MMHASLICMITLSIILIPALILTIRKQNSAIGHA